MCFVLFVLVLSLSLALMLTDDPNVFTCPVSHFDRLFPPCYYYLLFCLVQALLFCGLCSLFLIVPSDLILICLCSLVVDYPCVWVLILAVDDNS